MRVLTLVTVHYNTAEITIQCLESLQSNLPTELDYALVAVDNASDPEELQALEAYIEQSGNPRLVLKKSRVNTGFGWGNMMGIQEFPARYYLFINNDTLVDKDVFSPCIRFMEEHPDAGMCGIQILNPKGVPEVSFDHFASPWREILGRGLLERIQSDRPRRRSKYSKPLPVDYVNGSFMFVRSEDFDRLGGFDPHLFLYYEETDLCLRLLGMGRRTYFLPQLSYTHIQNASVRKTAQGAVKKIELMRSFLYITRKHYGLTARILMHAGFLLRYGLQSIVKPRYFPLFLYLLRGAPMSETLRLRQPIQSP